MCGNLPFDLTDEEEAYINKFIAVIRHGNESVKNQLAKLIEDEHTVLEKEDQQHAQSHDHSHSHSHENGHNHGHSHDHGHDHSHAHSHDHDHEHSHDHVHS